MTFGIGRLVADRTHVSWNGHRLVDPKTKQQPQTTTATILKIPLDKMLNLRLRPRSEEDDPAFRENMILTEVEEASVQFAVGKGETGQLRNGLDRPLISFARQTTNAPFLVLPN